MRSIATSSCESPDGDSEDISVETMDWWKEKCGFEERLWGGRGTGLVQPDGSTDLTGESNGRAFRGSGLGVRDWHSLLEAHN